MQSALSGERMRRGHERDDLRGAEGRLLEVVASQGCAHDGGIDVPGIEGRKIPRGPSRFGLDRHLRVPVGQRREEAARPAVAVGAREGESERAAGPVGDGADVGAQQGVAGEEIPSGVGEDLTGRGELDTVGGAHAQGRTEVGFEAFDLLGQGRLAEVQTCGGTAEVEFFGDGDEVVEALELHESRITPAYRPRGKRSWIPTPVPAQGGVMTTRCRDTESPAPTAAPTATPWSQHRLLHAVFLLMGAQLFLVPPLLDAIATDLGVSHAAAAWTMTGYVLGYAVSSPVLAALTDRWDRRTAILVGLAIFVAGDLGCALAVSEPMLALCHGVVGIGGGLAAPAMWAVFGETAADHERGRAIALGAAVYGAGQIIGVPLGSLLAATWGWRFAFGAVAAGMLVAGLLIAGRLREPEASTRVRRAPRQAWRSSLGLWTQRGFAGVIVATALTQAARIGTYGYIGVVFASRFGFSVVDLGLLGGAVGLGSMAGSYASGLLVDRWRQRGWPLMGLLAAWAVVLAGMIVIVFTTAEAGVAIAALLIWCAAGGACFSTAQATVSVEFAELRASAVSWNNAGLNAGVAVGTATLGVFAIGSVGFVAVAVAFALLGAACAGVMTLRST